MQKPLQLSEEMQKELVDDLAKLAHNESSIEQSPFIPRIKRVEQLTAERRQSHGNFRDNARLSQQLKSTFRSTAAWDHLDDVEKESLDMIALKISRILSGRSLEKQHWEDVEGYAHLALEECGQ